MRQVKKVKGRGPTSSIGFDDEEFDSAPASSSTK